MLSAKTFGRIRERMEAWMVAVTFAEAGTREAAMEAMALGQREGSWTRDRLQKRRPRRLRVSQIGV